MDLFGACVVALMQCSSEWMLCNEPLNGSKRSAACHMQGAVDTGCVAYGCIYVISHKSGALERNFHV